MTHEYHHYRPYEVFGITDEEVSRWRVNNESLNEILSNKNTIVHSVQTSSNLYGEFLFLTCSRGTGAKRACMTFYGLGYHQYRERWLSEEWFCYHIPPSLVAVHTTISKEDTDEVLVQRLADIQPHLVENTQTERGKQFGIFADLTDDDVALSVLRDLGMY